MQSRTRQGRAGQGRTVVERLFAIKAAMNRGEKGQWVTAEEYANHDCHQSREDGCETCALWADQQEFFARSIRHTPTWRTWDDLSHHEQKAYHELQEAND